MSDKRLGRPPMYETAASAKVIVRVTPAQRLELQRAADARGTGVADVIREYIDEHADDASDDA